MESVETNDVQSDVVQARPLQQYYCNACPSRVMSHGIPQHWFLIRRAVESDRLITVAICCSAKCIVIDAVNKLAMGR